MTGHIQDKGVMPQIPEFHIAHPEGKKKGFFDKTRNIELGSGANIKTVAGKELGKHEKLGRIDEMNYVVVPLTSDKGKISRVALHINDSAEVLFGSDKAIKGDKTKIAEKSQYKTAANELRKAENKLKASLKAQDKNLEKFGELLKTVGRFDKEGKETKTEIFTKEQIDALIEGTDEAANSVLAKMSGKDLAKAKELRKIGAEVEKSVKQYQNDLAAYDKACTTLQKQIGKVVQAHIPTRKTATPAQSSQTGQVAKPQSSSLGDKTTVLRPQTTTAKEPIAQAEKPATPVLAQTPAPAQTSKSEKAPVDLSKPEGVKAFKEGMASLMNEVSRYKLSDAAIELAKAEDPDISRAAKKVNEGLEWMSKGATKQQEIIEKGLKQLPASQKTVLKEFEELERIVAVGEESIAFWEEELTKAQGDLKLKTGQPVNNVVSAEGTMAALAAEAAAVANKLKPKDAQKLSHLTDPHPTETQIRDAQGVVERLAQETGPSGRVRSMLARVNKLPTSAKAGALVLTLGAITGGALWWMNDTGQSDKKILPNLQGYLRAFAGAIGQTLSQAGSILSASISKTIPEMANPPDIPEEYIEYCSELGNQTVCNSGFLQQVAQGAVGKMSAYQQDLMEQGDSDLLQAAYSLVSPETRHNIAVGFAFLGSRLPEISVPDFRGALASMQGKADALKARVFGGQGAYREEAASTKEKRVEWGNETAQEPTAGEGVAEKAPTPPPVNIPTVGQATPIKGGGKAPTPSPVKTPTAPVKTPTVGQATPIKGGGNAPIETSPRQSINVTESVSATQTPDVSGEGFSLDLSDTFEWLKGLPGEALGSVINNARNRIGEINKEIDSHGNVTGGIGKLVQKYPELGPLKEDFPSLSDTEFVKLVKGGIGWVEGAMKNGPAQFRNMLDDAYNRMPPGPSLAYMQDPDFVTVGACIALLITGLEAFTAVQRGKLPRSMPAMTDRDVVAKEFPKLLRGIPTLEERQAHIAELREHEQSPNQGVREAAREFREHVEWRSGKIEEYKKSIKEGLKNPNKFDKAQQALKDLHHLMTVNVHDYQMHEENLAAALQAARGTPQIMGAKHKQPAGAIPIKSAIDAHAAEIQGLEQLITDEAQAIKVRFKGQAPKRGRPLVDYQTRIAKLNNMRRRLEVLKTSS